MLNGPAPEGNGRSSTPEDALTRALFQAIAEASPAAFILIDLDGTVRFWSSAAERIFGWTAEEAVGHPYRGMRPEDQADFVSRLARIAEGDNNDGIEGERVRKDGALFSAMVWAAPFRVPGGELQCLVIVADVSGAKATAKRHADRFDFLSTASATMAGSLDADRMLSDVATLAVPAIADWCAIDLLEDGHVRRAAVGHPDARDRTIALDWWTRFPETEPANQFIYEIAQTRKSPGIVDFTDELISLNPNREMAQVIRDLRVRQALTVPIATRERFFGTLTMIMSDSARHFDAADAGVCEDLGNRLGVALENARLFAMEREARRRESKLHELTAELSKALTPAEVARVACRVGADASGAPAGALWLLAPDGTLVLEGHWGFPPEFLSQFRRIEPGRTSPAQIAVRAGEAHWVESEDDYVKHAPEVAKQASAIGRLESYAALPLKAGHAIQGLLSLSYGKWRTFRPEDRALLLTLAGHCGQALDRARLHERAEVASRIKDEFLATVSHELRTPLNAILGWSTILRRERAADGLPLKSVEAIHRNAQAQARIIEDILDVSRIVTGKLKLEAAPIDLAVVAADAIEVVRPSAAAKKIAIDFERQAERGPRREGDAEEPLTLVADRDRIQQVLWNLLSNAIKFTPVGGSVRLRIVRDDSTLKVEVSDTGRGIDPAFLPFVFERFKQADGTTTRQYGGLGLGLAIVRHIVELHGGHVAAASEGLDKGATFSVVLPVQAVIAPRSIRPEAILSPPRSPRPHHPLAGLRVLVVDDEQDARELLAIVLEEAGAVVQAAGSAAGARDALQAFRPQVIVSDIGMPGEDGFSFIRSVRALGDAEGGNTPAIALTAYAQASDRAKAIAAGFTTHIAKPVEPDTLLDVVARLAAPAR